MPADPVPYRPGETHRDPQGRFALVLPDGWVRDPGHASISADESVEELGFVERDPRGEPAYEGAPPPTIQVRVTRFGGGLDEAVENGREGLFRWTSGPHIDEPVSLRDGTPAHRLGVLPGDGAGAFALRETYVVNGPWLVVTSVYLPRAEWERLRAPFEATMDSITVPVAAPPPNGADLDGNRILPGQVYRDDAGLFTFAPPAGWYLSGPTPDPFEPLTATEGFRQLEFYPEGDSQRTIIRLRAFDGDDEPVPPLSAAVEDMRGALTGPLVRDEPVVLGDGTPAHLFEESAASERRIIALVAVGRGFEFTLTASTAPETRERDLPVLEAALRSLTLAG